MAIFKVLKVGNLIEFYRANSTSEVIRHLPTEDWLLIEELSNTQLISLTLNVTKEPVKLIDLVSDIQDDGLIASMIDYN